MDGLILSVGHRALVAEGLEVARCVRHVVQLLHRDHVGLRRHDHLLDLLPSPRPVDDRLEILGRTNGAELPLEGRHVAAARRVHLRQRVLHAHRLVRRIEHILHQEAVIRQTVGKDVPLHHTERVGGGAVARLEFDGLRSGHRLVGHAKLARTRVMRRRGARVELRASIVHPNVIRC